MNALIYGETGVSMLIIHKSRICNFDGGTKLETPITEITENNTNEHLVWCSTMPEYGKYLCTERCDALLIGLLHYALIHGHDIRSEIPASTELLVRLRECVIPLLAASSPRAKSISLDIPSSSEALPNAGAVGTGVSLGVDSSYSIMSHSSGSDSTLKLTHLLYFNVGSHGRGERARNLSERHLQRIKKFAGENAFKLVVLDSNFADEFKQHYEYIHFFAAAFAVFSLQKLWSDYFYASAGFSEHSMDFKDWDIQTNANFTLFLQGVFSTRNLRFYADAENKTRLEKTAALGTYAPAHKFLYVCTQEADNCCRCKKCMRTIVSLRALGLLDKFSQAFPPSRIPRRKWWFMILIKALKGDAFMREILRYVLKGKTGK